MTNNTGIKGIFLTFEGISNTIFDSQVALHIKEMKEQGADLEIIAFETWPGLYNKSLKRLPVASSIALSNIKLYRGVFVYIPLSELINAILLFFVIVRLKNKPQFIHARADYATSVCFLVSLILKIPIIWDCRGDTEAELKHAFKANNVYKKFLKHVALEFTKLQAFIAAKICSRAIFVTSLLYQRKGKYIKYKESIIIPTTASNKLFYYSEELRRQVRKKLYFRDEQDILIYTGGMVSYQNFPEYVRIFKNLHNLNTNLHFLVVTPDINRASNILEILDEKSYTLMNATFAEMNSLYNAADFGFLLRENNDINNVASPTKFSEYCLTGLPIIMNDCVKQSYSYAMQFGNLIPFNENFNYTDLIKLKTPERISIGNKASQILSRESNMKKYLSIYSFI